MKNASMTRDKKKNAYMKRKKNLVLKYKLLSRGNDEDVILIDDFSKYKYVPPRSNFGVIERDQNEEALTSIKKNEEALTSIKKNEEASTSIKNVSKDDGGQDPLPNHERSSDMMPPPEVQISHPARDVLDDDSDFETPPEARPKSGPRRMESDRVFVCEICKDDISDLDLGERSVHVNRCIDISTRLEASTSAACTSTCTFILECPLCFRQFQTPEMRSNHIKKCGKSRGLNIQSIFKAVQLQQKHARERISMGLPLKPQKPQKLQKKQGLKRLFEPKSRAQSDIQLAKALSLSLEEEERKKRGDFTSDAPLEGASAFELLPPSEFHRPGKKLLKKKGLTETPQLLLRTEEERQKLLLDRVAEILTPPPDLVHPKQLLELEETDTVKTAQHQQSPHVWLLSSKAREKGSYYVEDLQEWVKPSEVEPGSKVADLSQVPGHRIYTQQPCEYSFSVHDLEEENDVCIEEPSGIVDALTSLVLNPDLSDVDVLAASGTVLPAHRLILTVRCPTLQEVLCIPEGEEKYVLSLKDTSTNVVVQFLRYIYTGSAKWKKKDLSQVSSLAKRYHITELERLLDLEHIKNQREMNSKQDDVNNSDSRVTTSPFRQNKVTSPGYVGSFSNELANSLKNGNFLESECNNGLSTTSDDLDIVYNCINSSLRPTPHEDSKDELGGFLNLDRRCQMKPDNGVGDHTELDLVDYIDLKEVESPKERSCYLDFKNVKCTRLDSGDPQEIVLPDEDSNCDSVELMKSESQSIASDSSCKEVEILEVSQNRCNRQRMNILSPINELSPQAPRGVHDSFTPSKREQEFSKVESTSPQKHSKFVVAQSVEKRMECEAENVQSRVYLNSSDFETSGDYLEHGPRSFDSGDPNEIHLGLFSPLPESLTTDCNRSSANLPDRIKMHDEKSFEDPGSFTRGPRSSPTWDPNEIHLDLFSPHRESSTTECNRSSANLQDCIKMHDENSFEDPGTLTCGPRNSPTWDPNEIHLDLSSPYRDSLTTECNSSSANLQDRIKMHDEKSFEDDEVSSFCSIDESLKEELYQRKISGMKTDETKLKPTNSFVESVDDDVFVLHSSFDCDKQRDTIFTSKDKRSKSISNCSAGNSPAKVVENLTSFYGKLKNGSKMEQLQKELNGVPSLEEDSFGSLPFKMSSVSDNGDLQRARPQAKNYCLSQVQNVSRDRSFCSTPQKNSSPTSFSPSKVTKKSPQSPLSPGVIIFSSDDELFPELFPSKRRSRNKMHSNDDVNASGRKPFCERPPIEPVICEEDYNDDQAALSEDQNESGYSDDDSSIGISSRVKENSSPESSPFIPLSKRLFKVAHEESFEDFRLSKKREKKREKISNDLAFCRDETVSRTDIPSVSGVKGSCAANGEPSFRLSDSPVTPLPNYGGMMTPDIKMALKKIGVKALPKRKAIALLSQVYDATHPWVENGSTIDSESENVSKDEQKVINRKKRKSPSNKRDEAVKRLKCECMSGKMGLFGKSEDTSSSDECRADEVVEWEPSQQDNNEEEGPGKEDISSLRDQILNDEKLFERILHYKPLNLMEFQQELKDKGIKVSMQKLMDFMDEQCITFTCPRKEEYRKKQTTRSQNFRKRMIAKMSQKPHS